MVPANRPTRGVEPGRRGAERAGEGDVAERVAGEHLRAQHHEVAHQAAGQRDQRAGQQGVADERLREHAQAPRAQPRRRYALPPSSVRCPATAPRRRSREHVQPERERGDPEADAGRRRSRRSASPSQVTTSRAARVRARLSAGRAVKQLGGGRRHDEQREHEQRAGDLAVSAAASPSSTRKPTPSARVAPRGRGPRLDRRGEQQRAPAERQARERRTTATTSRVEHLARGDAQEGAEQQASVDAQKAMVESDEQKAAGQRERPAPCRSPPTPG